MDPCRKKNRSSSFIIGNLCLPIGNALCLLRSVRVLSVKFTWFCIFLVIYVTRRPLEGGQQSCRWSAAYWQSACPGAEPITSFAKGKRCFWAPPLTRHAGAVTSFACHVTCLNWRPASIFHESYNVTYKVLDPLWKSACRCAIFPQNEHCLI